MNLINKFFSVNIFLKLNITKVPSQNSFDLTQISPKPFRVNLLKINFFMLQ